MKRAALDVSDMLVSFPMVISPVVGLLDPKNILVSFLLTAHIFPYVIDMLMA